jgi:hypothetical protein
MAEVANPVFRPNTEFRSGEDLTSPKFEHLRQKYQLDTVFHGETDELKRILLLRHWIKSVIKIDDHGEPYPGEGAAEGILDAALKGHGFHCGHYMVVQNAVMNAYGYVTRTLGAGPGVKGGPDGHHGINEIWLNKYGKWFLSDAKYYHHFEKDGIPLSAAEVRAEYLKNEAADIVMVKGPERIPSETDEETKTNKTRFTQTYTNIEWHGYNNMFTAYPDYTELLIMYNDEYFKTHEWIWDNKPHWAFSHPECLKLVSSLDSIYWTPNTIGSRVTINGNLAAVELSSNTPNLKEYQVRKGKEDTWTATAEKAEFELKDKKEELHFRTMNLAGIPGQEHSIVFDRD